jgi:hypothetical protein
MLLNLSNHPSSAWSPEQMNAATEQFGGVYDEPFPNIDPFATEEQIRDLTVKYALDVATKYPFIPKAIHVMGEMTFTYSFVAVMEKAKMPCYASTTERTVLEEADGRKTVQFKFIQFRQYI